MVSIVIATYRRARWIRRCVESALGQSHAHVEVLVSDDQSPDETLQILSEIHDPRLVVIAQETNLGVWENWTSVVRAAQGEFLVFLGDDDWISERFVEQHLAAFAKCPEASSIFSRLEEVDGGEAPLRSVVSPFVVGAIVAPLVFLKAILEHQLFLGAAMHRRAVLAPVWEETHPDGLVADHGLLLRLALVLQAKVTSCEEPRYYKTVHAGQLSARFKEVSRLQLELMRRVKPLGRNRAARRLMAVFCAHVAILQGRHHAATGELDEARKLFREAWCHAPLLPFCWSQLAQAHLMPARLTRTSRIQRELPVD